MSGKMKALVLRRENLLAKIARQRANLAYEAQVLKPPLSAIDKGISFAHYLGEHPLLPALAAAAFVILKPGRTFKWLNRGWFFWGMYKNARNRLHENE